MCERCASLIDDMIALRKAKGLTQKELSAACGLTQSVIARIESKKSVPTIATLYQIITSLGASLQLAALFPEAEHDEIDEAMIREAAAINDGTHISLEELKAELSR